MNLRAASLLLVVSLPLTAQQKLTYPETKKVSQSDTFHGTVVHDPYRWLENDVRESTEVREWVEAQNKVTFRYLESLPQREAIRKHLTRLWNYEKYLVPQKIGGRYFFEKNDGLQNQYVLYVLDSLDSTPRVLIDPNTWSKDGTVALHDFVVSPTGQHVAYSVAEGGSDWQTWRVRDIATGRDLPEVIKWVKFATASWTRDGKGFFYGRYAEPKKEEAFQTVNLGMKVYYHRIDTPQSADVLVYERPEQPEWGFGNDVTEDGRYLILTVWKGTDDRYQILVKDLQEPYGAPVTLIGTFDHDYTFFGSEGTTLFFRTNDAAPRKRVIAIDLAKPARSNWREVIPQSEATLTHAELIGGRIVAHYLRDAQSVAKVFGVDGKPVRDVALGAIGKASGFYGEQSDPETFFSFASFATPPSIYHYNVVTGEKKLLFRANVAMNPDDYVVKQVFYKSKDGTRVPMFITHKKGLKLNGNTPTLLYGYGGFNIPETPAFAIAELTWVQMGGVYAVANIRGGGEYGEEWHKAGTKLQKQNVFDDFIAAAEWLIANKYTQPKKLAVQGVSNGGLLVGAVINQRPDLFAAALPEVGVMDMLRFHKFTAGRFWTDDYGSADNAEEFKALFAYSPYHNLRKGIDYPATLVVTADTDDRVVPGHSFKYAAALQQAHAGTDPVLIRIETRAGHGGGKPISKKIEEAADKWAFLAAQLGMQLPKNF